MTVIVWDGESLATDRQANDGSLKWESSKAWYVHSKNSGTLIVSGVGFLKEILELREWVAKGAITSEYPFLHKECASQLIVVSATDGLYVYDKSPYAVDRGFDPAALHSMHCGKGVEVFKLQERDDHEEN